MRKVIWMVLLAVVSSSAIAEWIKVGNDEDGVTIYANHATIRKAGNRVKIWSMYDLTKPESAANGKQYLSLKIQTEFDCKAEQLRELYYSNYSKNMGWGDLVFNYREPDSVKWKPLVPESINEALWKYVCGKQ